MSDIKRLNVILPLHIYRELELLAKTNHTSMTGIFRTALSLVALAYREAKVGNKLMVTDKKGNPIKEVIIPM